MNKMYNTIDNCFMHNTDSQVKAREPVDQWDD